MAKVLASLLAAASIDLGSSVSVVPQFLKDRHWAVYRRDKKKMTDDETVQGDDNEHYWPHARGSTVSYGRSDYEGPLGAIGETLQWKYSHYQGKFHTTVLGGPLIDEDRNIYLATEAEILKFSPEGKQIWVFQAPSDLVTVPSLMGNSLYGSSHDGHIFRVDLAKGKEVWLHKIGPSVGADGSYVEAHNGVVVLGSDAGHSGYGNTKVWGIDALDGSVLWIHTPKNLVMNLMPVFPDENSTMFMDSTGGVTRLNLFTGVPQWQVETPMDQDSFTIGQVILGQPGTQSAFACSNFHFGRGQEGTGGVLRKYNIVDGTQLWEQELPYPCNTAPATGWNPDAKTSTVVVAIAPLGDVPFSMMVPKMDAKAKASLHMDAITAGDKLRSMLAMPRVRTALMAFDPDTGDLQWRHEFPSYGRVAAAGDEEGHLERASLGHRSVCMPPGLTSPTIDPKGKVWFGRLDGKLYAYDPKVQKIDRYDTESAGLPPGVSFAPGMMAYATCDTLFVFKTKSRVKGSDKSDAANNPMMVRMDEAANKDRKRIVDFYQGLEEKEREKKAQEDAEWKARLAAESHAFELAAAEQEQRRKLAMQETAKKHKH